MSFRSMTASCNSRNVPVYVSSPSVLCGVISVCFLIATMIQRMILILICKAHSWLVATSMHPGILCTSTWLRHGFCSIFFAWLPAGGVFSWMVMLCTLFVGWQSTWSDWVWMLWVTTIIIHWAGQHWRLPTQQATTAKLLSKRSACADLLAHPATTTGGKQAVTVRISPCVPAGQCASWAAPEGTAARI